MISVTNVRLDMDGFDLINLEGLALNGRLKFDVSLFQF